MSLLERRRALMSLNKGILPPQYRQVEYIESSGTQCIITDLYFKSEYDVDFEFLVTDFPTNTTSNKNLWSTNDTNLDAYWHFNSNWGGSVGQEQYLCWKFYATTYTGITEANGKANTRTRVYSKGDYWYENVLWGFSNNGTNKMTAGKTSPVPLKLYGYYGARNNGIFNMCNLRFFYFKVTEGDTVIAHFIPCYRKSDSVAGMYDIVNDKFYTNSGTGEFLIGGEI